MYVTSVQSSLSHFAARMLQGLSLRLVLGLLVMASMSVTLSGCSLGAAFSYNPSDQHIEQETVEVVRDEPVNPRSEEYRIGIMIKALSVALSAPTRPQSLETVARYGTDSRYYVMIRGWLNEELSGVQSQLDSAQDHAAKVLLQQKSDFLRASIRRIDLE
jgi:hypothetical protein